MQMNMCSIFVVIPICLLQIDWSERLLQPAPQGLFEGVYSIVDGTLIEIARPKDAALQKDCWNGYKKINCVNFQIVVRISDGRIVAISGPLPGGLFSHDLTCWRYFRFAERLLPDERMLADRVYSALAEPSLLTGFRRPRGRQLNFCERLINHVISSVRVTVEQSIGVMKRFRILRNPFRGHNIQVLQKIVFVLARLANLIMQSEPVRKTSSPWLF